MKWANAVQDAGAVMIDLTNVTLNIYADVSKAMRIPVIGGQTSPESDGRIYVSYALVGYRSDAIDRADGSAAKYISTLPTKLSPTSTRARGRPRRAVAPHPTRERGRAR